MRKHIILTAFVLLSLGMGACSSGPAQTKADAKSATSAKTEGATEAGPTPKLKLRAEERKSDSAPDNESESIPNKQEDRESDKETDRAPDKEIDRAPKTEDSQADGHKSLKGEEADKAACTVFLDAASKLDNSQLSGGDNPEKAMKVLQSLVEPAGMAAKLADDPDLKQAFRDFRTVSQGGSGDPTEGVMNIAEPFFVVFDRCQRLRTGVGMFDE